MESLRPYPILYLAVSDWVMDAVSFGRQQKFVCSPSLDHVPGPAVAARASSPMKKSRSSVPLFMAR